jgi:hypothetical protein
MIDKIGLYTPDYRIDSQNSFTVKPHELPPDGNTPPPLVNIHGREGKSAHYNDPDGIFKADIVKHGLILTFNPAALDGTNEKTVSREEVIYAAEIVARKMKVAGIHADIAAMDVSRLDIQRTQNTAHPFIQYMPVLRGLTGSRLKSQEFGSTFTFQNKQREIQFYDKVAEVFYKHKKDLSAHGNLTRGELRFKKAEVVRNKIGHKTTLHSLCSPEIHDSLNNVYVKEMKKSIFKANTFSTDDNDGFLFNISDAVQMFEKHKAEKRFYFKDFLTKLCLRIIGTKPSDIDKICNVMKDILTQAGEDKHSISKKMRETREYLEELREENVIPSATLYAELLERFAS